MFDTGQDQEESTEINIFGEGAMAAGLSKEAKDGEEEEDARVLDRRFDYCEFPFQDPDKQVYNIPSRCLRLY